MPLTGRRYALLLSSLWVACIGPSLAGDEHAAPEIYYSVFHYEIEIEASPSEVWPHLVDFGSWMYEFDMLHVSGPRSGEGEIIRLYEGQDFLMQAVKIIPNKLYVGVHLPVEFRGELGTGTGILNLVETAEGTTVTNTMSRKYSWAHPEPNPLKATRQSAEFKESNRAMWEDRFLPRLKALAEGRED